MSKRLRTPFGDAHITRESAQLTAIRADSDLGVYYAQGFVAGKTRLWQLELTRRVASGNSAALFGPSCVAADRFQRNLGLTALARREEQRDARSEQALDVGAYVAGINHALDETRILPAELLLLRSRPERFEPVDIYLTGQLKHFINSTWKFEILQTLVGGSLGPERFADLFSTVSIEGQRIDPLPMHAGMQNTLAREAAEALRTGLTGLGELGLSSPDIGSNAFVVSGSHTKSGFPLLASDPHMGLVNPGFNLFFRLTSGEGLDVFGSHFPGAPGIVVGRNREVAWGFVGLMADNQDLLVGTLDDDSRRVCIAGQWHDLDVSEQRIEVRGGASISHTALGFSEGRLLCRAGSRALFLRWPALDTSLGSITLKELNRATDWESFRKGLARMNNAPMIAVYGDRSGNIGLQAVGLIPRREHAIGGLVLSLDNAQHAWRGYLGFDELPSQYNPPSGVIVYANQYTSELFGDRPPISTRWHPPSRALRILELIAHSSKHDAASFAAIQDDQVDEFARRELPWLRAQLTHEASFPAWSGDTRMTESALLFERWMAELTPAVLASVLPEKLWSAYPDQWPAFRWNLLAILRHPTNAWGLDSTEILTRALLKASRPEPHPRIEYRHALGRSRLGRVLFGAGHRYDGGSRETVHVARRNVDFLTSGQTARDTGKAGHFSFGPSFKFVYELSPAAKVHYLANAPNEGIPLGPGLGAAIRRWRRRERYSTSL